MRARHAAFLFCGAILASAGYSSTFLLTDLFRISGGSEIDTGRALGSAVFGTFVGIALVNFSRRPVGGARLAGLGAVMLALGNLIFAACAGSRRSGLIAGFLVGAGWGIYYLSAPLAVTERTDTHNRGFWFTRFWVFQIIGTSLSPAFAAFLMSVFHLGPAIVIAALAASSLMGAACLFRFDALLPRPPPGPAGRPSSASGLVGGLAEIAASRAIYPIIMGWCGASIFTSMMTFQGSLVAGAGLNKGTYFFVYAVVAALARFTLAPVVNRMDADRLSVWLLGLMNIGILAMLAVRFGILAQIASAAALGLGSGLLFPSIQTQTVNEAPPQRKEDALTCFVIAHFSGIFGFPVLGGFVIVHAGVSAFLLLVLLVGLFDLAVGLWRLRRPPAGA